MPDDNPQVPTEPATGNEPAGASAEPGQSVAELTAKLAVMESELAGYRVLEPVLAKLGEHPDVVQSLFREEAVGEGASTAPGAPAAAAPQVAGNGEGYDPRFDAMARENKQLREQFNDLNLTLGLDRCALEFGDDFDRKQVLEYVVKSGVSNPRDAYYALRGAKLSPDYIKGKVAEDVKAELARLAEANQASPAGVVGAGGPQPASEATANEGDVGPSVRESAIQDLRDTGMASPPAGLETTEGKE